MSQKYIIALEIGSAAVRAAAATFDPAAPDRTLTVQAVTREPLNGGVRYGRIQNIEDVTAAVSQTLHSLSEKPAMAGKEISGVYVGIGGRSLGTQGATSSLTLPDERDITADTVKRLQEEAIAEVPATREVLDLIPRGYLVDGIEAVRPVGSVGSRIAGTFTIVTADPVNTRNLERVVSKKLDLDIAGPVVRPLAIAETALTVDDTNPGCMLVDLGAETTTVSIFTRGKLLYIATIPLGSRNITRDLSAGLGITEERAEEVKVRLGNAMPASTTSPEQAEIDKHVQARAIEIAANVAAHIGFAGLTAADLRAGIIITGQGARLMGFSRLLQEEAGLEVRLATLPASVRIADPSIDAARNLDVIAIANAARQLAKAEDAVPCVFDMTPVEEETPEEETPEEESVTDYTGFNTTDTTDDPGYYVNTPEDTDDTDVLMDDEEAERLREQREREKRRSKQQHTSILDILGKRLSKIIGDKEEGNDLDDDY